MTPTQRRYLEFAVRHQGGELRHSPRSNGRGPIFRMIQKLREDGLIAFDGKRMGWFVTAKGKRQLALLTLKAGDSAVGGSYRGSQLVRLQSPPLLDE